MGVKVPVMTAKREGAPPVHDAAEVIWVASDRVPSRAALRRATPAHSIRCVFDRLHLRRRCRRQVEWLGHGWECNAADRGDKGERQ